MWTLNATSQLSSNFQAIQYNSMEKLKDSIKNMKKDGGYLDVCYLQSEFSLKKRENTHFYMTLLSYAAVHGQKEMVEVLLHRGASKCIINMLKVHGPGEQMQLECWQ